MLVGEFGDHAPAWGALDEAFHYEVGFIHLLNCSRIFANGGGYGGYADRTSLELVDDGKEDFVVGFVKAEAVDVERCESVLRDIVVDAS